jgi:hypothetical protein
VSHNILDPESQHNIFARVSYLAFSVLYIAYLVSKHVFHYLVELHKQIRDDKYLIGLQLQNVDHEGEKQGGGAGEGEREEGGQQEEGEEEGQIAQQPVAGFEEDRRGEQEV